MLWRDFNYEGIEYDLSHLHPFDLSFTAPASGKRPERTYDLQVTFSMHAFTHGMKDDEDTQGLLYRDARETRVFDFKRYDLSKQLPDIVKKLGERRCFHTHHGSFFTIELVGEDGQKEEYEIYFKVSRASQKGRLNVYIQSAYVRDDKHHTSQPKKRKIGFQVIAYNVMHGKRISPGK